MDKNATHVDVAYIKYCIDLERIREYNWGESCLVYLYSKLDKTSYLKTRQMQENNCHFQIIYIHVPY